jgi:hypothetical protein
VSGDSLPHLLQTIEFPIATTSTLTLCAGRAERAVTALATLDDSTADRIGLTGSACALIGAYWPDGAAKILDSGL